MMSIEGAKGYTLSTDTYSVTKTLLPFDKWFDARLATADLNFGSNFSPASCTSDACSYLLCTFQVA